MPDPIHAPTDDRLRQPAPPRLVPDPALVPPTVPPVGANFGAVPAVDPDQMSLINPGLTNPAGMAANRVGTWSFEGTVFAPFQSPTDPDAGVSFNPSLLLSLRYRIGANAELGVLGSLGGMLPLHHPAPPVGHDPAPAVATGSAGASLHLGPRAPSGEGVHFGVGTWFTLSQNWGLEPQRTSPPPYWSFNPSATNLTAFSWVRKDTWALDAVTGAGIARWGQVNGVPVAFPLTPFIGLNYARNVSDSDVLNVEATVGANLGLGGRADGPTDPRVPTSLSLAAGIGWQRARGNYAIGIEPYFFAEPTSNLANPQGGFGNYGGGLRVGFGWLHAPRAAPGR